MTWVHKNIKICGHDKEVREECSWHTDYCGFKDGVECIMRRLRRK